MKQENLNIITIQDIKKIKTVSFLNDDVMVVNDNDIYLIPKPTYPVRMKYFVLVYCFAGSASFTVNTIQYQIFANQILVMPSECVMTIEKLTDFKAFFVVISQKYMDEVMTQCSAIWKALTILNRDIIHSIKDNEAEIIQSYIKKLSECCTDLTNKYRKEIIRFQIISMLHELCNMCVEEENDQKVFQNRNKQIYIDFLQLVIRNFRKEHSVAFYADKLCITPKYLSMAIKEAEGKTPSETIQRFLIQEAMLLLKNTNMTIKQIADELNFLNPSFFCRYFRKYAGTTPIEYRTKSV